MIEQCILQTACGARKFAQFERDKEGKVPRCIEVPLINALGTNRFVEAYQEQFKEPKFIHATRRFVPFTSIQIPYFGRLIVFIEDGTYAYKEREKIND